MKKTLFSIIFSLSVVLCLAQENDKKQVVTKNDTVMEQKITTFLTFQKNDAEEAMNFYVSLFDNSKVIDIQRWGKEGPGKEGTIMHATFQLAGLKFACSDSPPVHTWDFTPAVSNYVECESEEEIKKLWEKLSENGQVAMLWTTTVLAKNSVGWLTDLVFRGN